MKNSAREILLAQSPRDRCRGKGASAVRAKDSANGRGKSKYYIISLLYAIGISAQIIILFTKRTGIHISVLLLRSLSGTISSRGASRKHPRKCLLVSTRRRRRRVNRAPRAESLLRVNFPGKPISVSDACSLSSGITIYYNNNNQRRRTILRYYYCYRFTSHKFSYLCRRRRRRRFRMLFQKQFWSSSPLEVRVNYIMFYAFNTTRIFLRHLLF